MTNLIRYAVLSACVVISGCANFSEDGGVNAVRETVRTTLGRDVQAPRTDAERALATKRVETLLLAPLAADDAVEIALLNNRGLRATYAQLGIAEADLVQAGRLPNPRFSMLRARRDDEIKIEQAITMNIVAVGGRCS
jgi:hypothetical protein